MSIDRCKACFTISKELDKSVLDGMSGTEETTQQPYKPICTGQKTLESQPGNAKGKQVTIQVPKSNPQTQGAESKAEHNKQQAAKRVQAKAGKSSAQPSPKGRPSSLTSPNSAQRVRERVRREATPVTPLRRSERLKNTQQGNRPL